MQDHKIYPVKQIRLSVISILILAGVVLLAVNQPWFNQPPLQELQAAPETLVIQGHAVKLDVLLGYSEHIYIFSSYFQIIFWQLTHAENTLKISADLKLDGQEDSLHNYTLTRVWVMNPNTVWASNFYDDSAVIYNLRLEGTFQLDVVVELVDSMGNKYLLRVAQQPLHMAF
jgi:hypothetical protein